MGKKVFKAGTMLNPVPAVMVSCGTLDKPNIITIAWTGTINSDPPMTYVSIRKSRYSHGIISESGEFVINLVNEELAFAADFCGVKSGRDVDKFDTQNLTPQASEIVSCPSVAEAPVSIECRVVEVKELPSHDMFIAEIVSVSVDEKLLDANGRFCMEKAELVAYNHGHYFGLKKQELGRFGYSVMKPKTKKRIEAQKRAKSRAVSRQAKKSKK